MKVEINVDETQFKELLDNHLSTLPEDTIKDIIVESIRAYFSQNNYEKIEQLFIDSRTSYGGYTEKCANYFLKKLVSDCDYSKLQEVVDVSIDDLKENHERILKDLFIEAIVKSLNNTYSFRETVTQILYEARR